MADLNRIIEELRGANSDLSSENSRPMKIAQAKRRFSAFNDGAKKPHVTALQKPKDDVTYALGRLVAVVYEADTSDGNNSRYIHEFSSKSQPHLAVSFDGKQLYILGGGYIVDERGIVDAPKSIKRKGIK